MCTAAVYLRVLMCSSHAHASFTAARQLAVPSYQSCRLSVQPEPRKLSKISLDDLMACPVDVTLAHSAAEHIEKEHEDSMPCPGCFVVTINLLLMSPTS